MESPSRQGIKGLIDHLGLTQRQFSAEIGISEGAVSKLVRQEEDGGRSNPEAETLRRIKARWPWVDLNYYLGGE